MTCAQVLVVFRHFGGPIRVLGLLFLSRPWGMSLHTAYDEFSQSRSVLTEVLKGPASLLRDFDACSEGVFQ